MSGTRLVSFLGLGNEGRYAATRYKLGDKVSGETTLTIAALHELVGDVSSIVVLGTAEVERHWIESGRLGADLPAPFTFRRAEGEPWDVFGSVLDALAAAPMPDTGESSAPERIVLDVTHGFRVHPLLATAALSFAVSDWARRGQDGPAVRILYAAYERRGDDGVSPIWDVTEVVSAGRWNAAIDALLRYGRADALEALAGQAKKENIAAARARGESGSELASYNAPVLLGKRARAFSDDMALARLRNLVTCSAPQLRDVLGRTEIHDLGERLPVLRPALDQLRREVGPLCAERVMSIEGLHATAELAVLCGKRQRFAELAAVLREALITHHAHATGSPPRCEPGSGDFARERKSCEERWTDAISKNRQSRPDDDVGRNLRLADAAAQDRNDIEHGGMNDKPAQARCLRQRLLDHAGDLLDLVKGRPAAAPETSRCFVNLSNHSVAAWSTAQRDRAVALGFGEPVDLPGGMPLVPPDAETEAVDALAAGLAGRVAAMGGLGAHVAGEATLCLALVRELRARGMHCFAATTERVARESVVAGATERTSTFLFVRWREYPR